VASLSGISTALTRQWSFTLFARSQAPPALPPAVLGLGCWLFLPEASPPARVLQNQPRLSGEELPGPLPGFTPANASTRPPISRAKQLAGRPRSSATLLDRPPHRISVFIKAGYSRLSKSTFSPVMGNTAMHIIEEFCKICPRDFEMLIGKFSRVRLCPVV